eukprot:COSAG01_NODE_10460_length_2160_cov_22.833576_1_plen_174_part_00
MVTPADLADLAVRAAHASVRSQLCAAYAVPRPPRRSAAAADGGCRRPAPGRAGRRPPWRRLEGRGSTRAGGRACAKGLVPQSALSQEEPIAEEQDDLAATCAAAAASKGRRRRCRSKPGRGRGGGLQRALHRDWRLSAPHPRHGFALPSPSSPPYCAFWSVCPVLPPPPPLPY